MEFGSVYFIFISFHLFISVTLNAL